MGDTNTLFNMSPDTANALMNFGFATAAAAQTPGSTFGGAIGKGFQGMNQANNLNAQTQNLKQEGIGKQLTNAMTLRQLNMQNMMYGQPQVNVPGVQNLMQSATPSSGMATPASSPSAGGGLPLPSTRTAPSGQSSPLPIPQTLANMGYTQTAYDVARGVGVPQNRQDLMQAAQLKNLMGDSEGAKAMESTALKGYEPVDLRQGGSQIDPLGSTTVNPAHIQNVEGNTVPFAPSPVKYDNRNAVSGVRGIPPIPELPPAPDFTQAAPGATPPPSDNRNAGQGIKTGWSPQETETQKNYFGKETDNYNGAVKSMQNLQLMQHSIDTLNQPGSELNTGTWGEKKLGFAKALQSAGFNTFDPNEIAAGESLLKTTGRLGFDMSKQLGAREPGIITQQAIKLNPGIENTPQGIQLLHDSVAEEAQRVIDEHNFKGQYYQNNGYNQQKAEAAFDGQYSPALYAQRAVSQTSPIKVNTPAGAKQLLAGTKFKSPDGKVRVVPPGIGLTPPSYQSVTQPQTPNTQEAPESD